MAPPEGTEQSRQPPQDKSANQWWALREKVKRGCPLEMKREMSLNEG